MLVKFMGQVLGDSQAEVIRERNAVVLTFGHGDVAPMVGAVDAGSAIRIGGLVSGKLNSFRIQSAEAIDPRKGSHKITARWRHFCLWIFLAVCNIDYRIEISSRCTLSQTVEHELWDCEAAILFPTGSSISA